jgi:hypothetical protein
MASHITKNMRVIMIKSAKKSLSVTGKAFFSDKKLLNYIIPPIPGPPGGIGAGFSSFSSTKTASVVRNIPAIEAAFSRAIRVTFAGSITPVS